MESSVEDKKYCIRIPLVPSNEYGRSTGFISHYYSINGGNFELKENGNIDTEPDIVLNDDDKIVAQGFVDVISWLSFRRVPKFPNALGILCGKTKEEKRKISRGIKRVRMWIKDWKDFACDPREKMLDALWGPLLLDKKIRHRNMRYISDYTTADCKDNTHPTAADVLLTIVISDWLTVFESFQTLLMQKLPSIIYYVQNIRRELQQLERDQIGDMVQCNMYKRYISDSEKWFDSVHVTLGAEFVFKFTHQSALKKIERIGVDDGGDGGDVKRYAAKQGDCCEDEVIDHLAASLVGMTDWKQPMWSNYKYLVSKNGQLFAERLTDELWLQMKLPPGREERKIQQITSLLEQIDALLPIDGTAVEFCSGGGYVGIPLALLRPDCKIILTDMNSVSLAFAQQRIDVLGLQNITLIRCELTGIEADISSLQALQLFDVGIALHACGSATDAVLRICHKRGAAFVVSPCCYGFLQHYTMPYCDDNSNNNSKVDAGNTLVYPRSHAFKSHGWKSRWFAAMCSRADRTFWAHDSRAAKHNPAGRFAMQVIDADRLLTAKEEDYCAFATYIQPIEASTKNHILVGRKASAANPEIELGSVALVANEKAL